MEEQPVSVIFDVTPETAVIAVYPVATEEAPNPETIPAEEDGSFLLLPGEYTYTAEAKGYVSAENVPFTVADEPLTLTVALEAVEEEPVAFDQSQTVNGVVVRVQAASSGSPKQQPSRPAHGARPSHM